MNLVLLYLFLILAGLHEEYFFANGFSFKPVSKNLESINVMSYLRFWLGVFLSPYHLYKEINNFFRQRKTSEILLGLNLLELKN